MMHGTINTKLSAYSCICWLFHRIYYDARNHKHKIHTVCMSSHNVGHLITRTITTLQHLATLHHTPPSYTSPHSTQLHFTTLHPTTLHHTSPNCTSPHLSTLHFLSFTLHYPLIWLNPLTFPTALFHLTSLN